MEESREMESSIRPNRSRKRSTRPRDAVSGQGVRNRRAHRMAPQAFARKFIDKYDPDGPLARYPNPELSAWTSASNTSWAHPIIRTIAARCGPKVGLEPGRAFSIWGDIHNKNKLRWIEEDGHVSRQFRSGGQLNGNFSTIRDARSIRARHAERGRLRTRR